MPQNEAQTDTDLSEHLDSLDTLTLTLYHQRGRRLIKLWFSHSSRCNCHIDFSKLIQLCVMIGAGDHQSITSYSKSGETICTKMNQTPSTSKANT